MRFFARRIGAQPDGGYPLFIALHGGGGAPADVNDRQWKHMQSYYADSISEGIYVAPRGITNNWNLHFDGGSYALYDVLIERMIQREGVNPDRVYLLGFSAGGDGVYQIVPRMADRFAAANMSAGHPNGVPATNLYQVPMLLQMGARDTAYDRHRAAAQYHAQLQVLQAEHPGGYVHDLFLHKGGGHNAPWSDRDPSPDARYPVVADPAAWLEKASGGGVRHVDSNAVRWLAAHVRDPWPQHLIWTPGLRAERQGRERLWYWLAIDEDTATDARIEVSYDPAQNSVTVTTMGDRLRVRLRPEMLDLSQPITVSAGGEVVTVSVSPDPDLVARTQHERGDPQYVFSAELVLQREGDRITVLEPSTGSSG